MNYALFSVGLDRVPVNTPQQHYALNPKAALTQNPEPFARSWQPLAVVCVRHGALVGESV